jgi:hypothetical protein
MSSEPINKILSETANTSANCESGVFDSTTLSECENKFSIPMGRTGPLIAKLPVVLSDIEVQIDVEAVIKIEESAVSIKTIDKHIYLTQCKLVPHTDKLFIEGYVQKKLQFATMNCTSGTAISGNVQHSTVNVPFKCVTKIQFSRRPMYGEEYKKKLSALDDNMMNKNQKEDSWIHYSKLYEPVYCELEYAKILETEIFNQTAPMNKTLPEEKAFNELEEKMVIFIRLKILQNQQVFIPEPNGEVNVIQTCRQDYNSNDKKCNVIEVGYDNEKGMIGRELITEDFNEN